MSSASVARLEVEDMLKTMGPTLTLNHVLGERWPETDALLARIPDYMHDSIAWHVLFGFEDNNFLDAILTNDLKGSFGSADSTNVQHIHDYVRFFHNCVPMQCWGSVENVVAWREAGGMFPDVDPQPEEGAIEESTSL